MNLDISFKKKFYYTIKPIKIVGFNFKIVWECSKMILKNR